jgi:peptidoglycan/xylan/chitin deacetylase (PgdA/CDA1 family)
MLPPLGYAIGAAAGLLAYAGYASMAPASQLYGRTFTRGNNPRQLALTFDDGPNDPYSLHLLDVLAEHQVKATFFLIGRYVTQLPEVVRRIAQAGYVIGNHSYSHPNLIFGTAAGAAREISDCAKAIDDAVGAHSKLFRPPFGGRRPGVLRTIRKLGLTPIMWSVTCYDWRDSASAASIARCAQRQIKRGAGNVVLLHDGGHKALGEDRSNTVAATREIIRVHKAEGYEFVTIPEMMQSSAGVMTTRVAR